MLQHSNTKDIDIIIFPEMAFSGYLYNGTQEVKHIAEKQTKGIIFQYCKQKAQKL